MDYAALEHMTVMKLREEAKKYPDARGVSAMKKNELIEFLAEKLGLEKPATRPKAKGKKPATPLDKKTIKKRILELREQREQARSSNEKKKVEVLRKRIHSLKRRMRRIA